MLVLSRHANESIIIGDSIIVEVLMIGQDWVKLAIRAPAEIPVYREEVWLRIQQERQASNHEGK